MMRNKPMMTVAIRRGRMTIRVCQTRTVGYLSTPQSTKSDVWSLQASVGSSSQLIALTWLHIGNAPGFFLCLRGRKLAILQQNSKGVPLILEGHCPLHR